MKKVIFSILVFVSVCSWAQSGMIDVNGTLYPVDTLENYMVGPGVRYTRFSFTIKSTVHHLYQMEIDLSNPYITLEEWQGKESVGSTELLSDAYKKLSYTDHRPIGGVNCNFWVVQGNIDYDPKNLTGLMGVPFAGTARNGVLIGEPNSWNAGHGYRGYVVLDDQNRAYIREMGFDGEVRKDTAHYPIHDVDRSRTNFGKNEICLFNEYLGSRSTRSLSDGKVEVLFELTDSAWAINKTVHARVSSVNTHGGSILPKGHGALQCVGKGAAWATENLEEGDDFEIWLGVQATMADSIAPMIRQMVTGNCLVMENGVLNNRNTNEDYNNRNYARTMLATNNAGDRFWMLVSQTPGNYTAEMCGILKNNGATWAAGMDGGGSAQMNLLGKVMNKTTEASPRSVANGMFVVATSPDDSVVGRLDYMNAAPAVLAAYSSFTPVLYAYNQYGILLEKDFTDYTLTVSPATLGTISSDGRTFIAGSESGEGVLTASAGSAQVSKSITVQGGQVQFRLDSVVTDRGGYAVEAYALAGEEKQPVSPSLFTWTVEDESVCQVDADGVLKGKTNGRSLVRGELGSNIDTILAIVEIAEAKHVALGTQVDTVIQRTGRTTKLDIVVEQMLFGRPDSILLEINSEAGIQTVTISMKANNAKEQRISLSSAYTPGTDFAYVLDVNKVGEVDDAAKYPLYMNTITFSFNDMTSGKDYRFRLYGITLCYATWQEVEEGLEMLPQGKTLTEQKIMVDGVLYIIDHGTVYDMQGNIIRNDLRSK